MIWKNHLVATALLLLAGCAATASTSSSQDSLAQSSRAEIMQYAVANATYLRTNSERNLIEASVDAIRNRMKDPASAQFRNVRLRPYGSGQVVCGEVNAKNSYGGYVGFVPFVASAFVGRLEETDRRYPSINAMANTGLVEACGR